MPKRGKEDKMPGGGGREQIWGGMPERGKEDKMRGLLRKKIWGAGYAVEG